MTRSNNKILTLIVSVILLIFEAPTYAGIVVESGIIESSTHSGSGYESGTVATIDFNVGSYNTQVTNETEYSFSAAVNNADELTTQLNDYENANPNVLSRTVTYIFDVQEIISGTRLYAGSYYDTSTGAWKSDNNGSFVAASDTTVNYGTDVTIYWATPAPENTTSNSGVPEPSTAIAMGLLGVVGFAGNRRRRRQVSAA